jgi:hypothetical protein
MSEGFKDEKVEIEVQLNKNEINKILKKYKQAKKYMKSSLYEVKKLNGTETYITNLIKEAEDTPL